jgi:hypothetical protein
VGQDGFQLAALDPIQFWDDRLVCIFSQRGRLLICLSQGGPSMNTHLLITKSLTNPRPIVHRAGGMLIQALKEHLICADIKPNDVFFYYTTTGWMMFN